MGQVDQIVETATAKSVVESEKFLGAVEVFLAGSRSLQQAQDGLALMLTRPNGAGMGQVAYEGTFRAQMLGMIEESDQDGNIVVALAEKSFASAPFSEAVNFFKKKKIVSPRVFKRLDDEAKRNAFSVAGATRLYTIEQTHDLIGEALDKRWSVGRLTKEFKRRSASWGLSSKGNHHLETVFLTNIHGAYNAGHHAQMIRSTKLRPFWRYQTQGDNVVRVAHRAMNGRTYAHDDPIWATWYPPNGFRCRCTVVSLSKRQVKGVHSKPPRIKGIPAVPDKGFSGSPADAARTARAMKNIDRQLKKSKLLRPPKIATGYPGKSVFTDAGDLTRVREGARIAKVEDLSGLSEPVVDRLVSERPHFKIFPGGFKPPKKGRLIVEVAIHSQNEAGITRLASRLSADGRFTKTIEKARLVPQLSYGVTDTRVAQGLETAFDAKAARRLNLPDGFTLGRSTEHVLRMSAGSATEARALAREVLEATERGHGAPIPGAWDIGDVKVRGAMKTPPPGFKAAFINTRRMGKGDQLIVTKQPIRGFQSEEIFVNEKVYRVLE